MTHRLSKIDGLQTKIEDYITQNIEEIVKDYEGEILKVLSEKYIISKK